MDYLNQKADGGLMSYHGLSLVERKTKESDKSYSLVEPAYEVNVMSCKGHFIPELAQNLLDEKSKKIDMCKDTKNFIPVIAFTILKDNLPVVNKKWNEKFVDKIESLKKSIKRNPKKIVLAAVAAASIFTSMPAFAKSKSDKNMNNSKIEASYNFAYEDFSDADLNFAKLECANLEQETMYYGINFPSDEKVGVFSSSIKDGKSIGEAFSSTFGEDALTNARLSKAEKDFNPSKVFKGNKQTLNNFCSSIADGSDVAEAASKSYKSLDRNAREYGIGY